MATPPEGKPLQRNVDATTQITPEQRAEILRRAREQGTSEVQAAAEIAEEQKQQQALEKEPGETGKQVTLAEQRRRRELHRQRAVRQVNIVLEHAGQLRTTLDAMHDAGSADELEAQKQLAEQLILHAPIVVQSKLDTAGTARRLEALVGMRATDQPFPDGVLPELSDEQRKLLGVAKSHRVSMLREPRVLVLDEVPAGPEKGKLFVTSASLDTIVVKALQSGVVTWRELNQSALGQLRPQDRAAIEKAAEPKKRAT